MDDRRTTAKRGRPRDLAAQGQGSQLDPCQRRVPELMRCQPRAISGPFPNRADDPLAPHKPIPQGGTHPGRSAPAAGLNPRRGRTAHASPGRAGPRRWRGSPSEPACRLARWRVAGCRPCTAGGRDAAGVRVGSIEWASGPASQGGRDGTKPRLGWFSHKAELCGVGGGGGGGTRRQTSSMVGVVGGPSIGDGGRSPSVVTDSLRFAVEGGEAIR